MQGGIFCSVYYCFPRKYDYFENKRQLVILISETEKAESKYFWLKSVKLILQHPPSKNCNPAKQKLSCFCISLSFSLSFSLCLTQQSMDLSTASASVKITKENESRCREEALDIFRVQKDAKRLFLCRERRECSLLQSKLGDLRKNSEMELQKYKHDEQDLQWDLYNLRLGKTRMTGTFLHLLVRTHVIRLWV